MSFTNCVLPSRLTDDHSLPYLVGLMLLTGTGGPQLSLFPMWPSYMGSMYVVPFAWTLAHAVSGRPLARFMEVVLLHTAIQMEASGRKDGWGEQAARFFFDVRCGDLAIRAESTLCWASPVGVGCARVQRPPGASNLQRLGA